MIRMCDICDVLKNNLFSGLSVYDSLWRGGLRSLVSAMLLYKLSWSR